MRVSRKALSAFNGGAESKFNENYNRAYGLPNLIEQSLLLQVRESVHGICNPKGKITQKQVEDYLIHNKFELSEALIRHAQREGLKI